MIGRLRNVVLDSPNPEKLAEFYAEVLGAAITERDPAWTTAVAPDGQRIAFQRAPNYKPPTFPDPEGSQQLHFDIRVTDVELAESQVLALGAKRLAGQGGDGRQGFRVFADPDGHPFCLVWES